MKFAPNVKDSRMICYHCDYQELASLEGVLRPSLASCHQAASNCFCSSTPSTLFQSRSAKDGSHFSSSTGKPPGLRAAYLRIKVDNICSGLDCDFTPARLIAAALSCFNFVLRCWLRQKWVNDQARAPAEEPGC